MSFSKSMLILLLAVALAAGPWLSVPAPAQAVSQASTGTVLQPTPVPTLPGQPPAADQPPARSWILLLGMILGCMIFMLVLGIGISIVMVRIRERL